jgi:cytochrome c-type biogenesis protein CcmE
MMYYLTVTEFVQQADNAAGDYKINGKVSTGSIERMNTGMDVRFIITDGASSLPVSYHGVIPDTFVEDAAVVVEGRLRDGTFVAHNLLAKCPSKYEAADGDETARLEASLRD